MQAGKLFRAEDWWIGKAAHLFGLVYLFTLCFSIPFSHFGFWAICSLVTIIGFASFGYLVNDYFDQEKDAIVGKKNFLLGKSMLAKAAYCSLSLFLVFAPWYFLPNTWVSLVLIFFQLFLYVVYSLPFIRLKERGVLGVVTDALYAHAIPSLLAAYTYTLIAYKPVDWLFLVLLFSWQFFVGLRNVLLHQINDLESDKKSGTRTFVSGDNVTWAGRLLWILTATEILLLIALLIDVSFQNSLLFISILTIAMASAINFFMDRKNGYRIYFPNLIYEQWLPYTFIGILSVQDYRFLLLFPFQAVLFSGNFLLAILHRIGLFYRLNLRMRLIRIAHYIFNGFRLLINWAIYFMFRLFGIDLKKEKTDARGYILRKINKQK